MKHLLDTPWWICDEKDTNYCSYVDTDSNYFHAEPILRHLHSNFDEMSEKEKDNALNADAAGFTPKNGDLYLFPATMEHNVSPNNSDIKRLSVAFNYMMRGIVKSEYRDVKI